MSATETGLSTVRPLLNDEQLLKVLFDEASRPSPYWLRDQRTARKIPFVRMGRRIFYDLEDVRAAIRDRHTVKRRGA